MSTHGPDGSHGIPSEVTQWLANQKSPPQSVVLLGGDGSVRQFYRVIWENESRVLVRDPQWKLTVDYPAHQSFLAGKGLPVPHFEPADPAAGFMLMEDLGDELLQARLAKEPSHRRDWLGKAATLLGDLHGKTFPVPDGLPVRTRAFDFEKYRDELRFTWTHLSEGYLGGGALSATGAAQLELFCRSLTALGPTVFAHRDYHCRNLMVHKGALYLIDFQDARMGPPHYDFASLIYDPYLEADEEERRFLEQRYRLSLTHYPLCSDIQWDRFQEDTALVGLQRVVKAAGSFAYFFVKNGKPTHLRYLKPALSTARQLLTVAEKKYGTLKDAFPIDLWLQLLEKRGP